MKRSEITEGAEVYFAETNTYEETSYGTQGKATVIMVAARKLGPRWESPARYGPVDAGDHDYRKAKVLVVLDRGDDYAKEQMLVPLNQLRGPYVETLARVEASRAAIAAHRRESETRAQTRQARARELQTALASAIDAKPWTVEISGRYTSDPQVTLTLDGAQQLLDALEKAQSGLRELARDVQDMRRERMNEV